MASSDWIQFSDPLSGYSQQPLIAGAVYLMPSSGLHVYLHLHAHIQVIKIKESLESAGVFNI